MALQIVSEQTVFIRFFCFNISEKFSDFGSIFLFHGAEEQGFDSFIQVRGWMPFFSSCGLWSYAPLWSCSGRPEVWV